jgi:hypothetical protein
MGTTMSLAAGAATGAIIWLLSAVCGLITGASHRPGKTPRTIALTIIVAAGLYLGATLIVGTLE